MKTNEKNMKKNRGGGASINIKMMSFYLHNNSRGQCND